jgi:hypothetical protein
MLIAAAGRGLERTVSVRGVLLVAMSLCGGVAVANADEISNAFAGALVSKSRSPEIAASEDIYAKLLGAWDVQARDRTDDGTFQVIEGEWFFARTLEGRAVQDVWIAPTRANRRTAVPGANRYGSSVRTFDPRTRVWQVTWFNPVTGAFNVLQTRMEGERIVQEGTLSDGRRIRWIFQEITGHAFHWTGEAQLPDGSWRLEAEFFGRRRTARE